jgi:hypothetical protein
VKFEHPLIEKPKQSLSNNYVCKSILNALQSANIVASDNGNDDNDRNHGNNNINPRLTKLS